MLSERGDPPPGPHPSKLIDELTKDYLAPVMKDKGFRKSGANFWRDNANGIDVLNIQRANGMMFGKRPFMLISALTGRHSIGTNA